MTIPTDGLLLAHAATRARWCRFLQRRGGAKWFTAPAHQRAFAALVACYGADVQHPVALDATESRLAADSPALLAFYAAMRVPGAILTAIPFRRVARWRLRSARKNAPSRGAGA